MRNKLVYKYLGKVLLAFSALCIVPILVSIFYHENIISFLIPGIISLILGYFLNLIKAEKQTLYSKDGFIIVALAWIIISILGAIPFMIDCNVSFYDAFFESVSGFTTTGATIFKNVDALSKSIIFWRAFTHYIGGLGVLGFVMAVIPLSKDDKSMHILKAEMSGPTISKLVPNIKKTLLYLYVIYIVLTLAEIVLLLFGKINLFNSIVVSMSTAGTGGFSYLNSSLATYSMYNQYVVAIFMFLFGVNFNLYFLVATTRSLKAAFKSEELKLYIVIYIFAVGFVLMNTVNMFSSFADALASSAFHISSFMTCTGFSVGDINIYPTSCRFLILCLMIMGACAGSTSGGFKISRFIIWFKSIKREFLKVIHPSNVHTITFEGKKVDDDTIRNTCSFIFLYLFFIILVIFLVSFNGFSLETTINAVVCTFANAGLCFNISNFSIFNDFSKMVLSFGMLFGRLEIFPLLALISSIRNK